MTWNFATRISPDSCALKVFEYILISENNNHRGAEVNPHVVPFSLPFILAKRVSRFSGVTLGHEMELDEWMGGRE